MKFTISRYDLLKELNFLQGAIEKKSTIPILQNIHIEANNNRLRLRATDLDIHALAIANAEVYSSGSACIPGKRLFDIIKAFPDAEIEIETTNGVAVIKCQRSRFRLTMLDEVNYPEAPVVPTSMLPIDSSMIAKMIDRVGFAATKEQSRYSLNGIKFELKSGKLRMVATDGHRLSFIEHDAYFEGGDFDQILPSKTLELVAKLATTAEKIFFGFNLGVSLNTVFFQVDQRTIVSRFVAGQFPDYNRVIEKHPLAITVKSNDLSAAFRRMLLIANSIVPTVQVKFNQASLEVSAAASDVGEGGEEVFAEIPEIIQNQSIALNANYVLNFLDALGSSNQEESVVIQYKDDSSSILFRPQNNGNYDYLYIVMPIRKN